MTLPISTDSAAACALIHFELDFAEPLSSALVARLSACCDQAEDAVGPALLVLQLRGQRQLGAAPAISGAPAMALVGQWERTLCRIEKLAVPSVALAAGHCHGLLLELLLTADYRIAGCDARFSLAAADAAIWPGMALHRLAAQIGLARARPLVLFGAQLSASAALELGLVGSIDSAATPAVGQAVAWHAGDAARDLPVRRRLLLEAGASSYEEALGSHLAACDRTLRQSAAQAQRHAESLLQRA